jgi:hypothetical protein
MNALNDCWEGYGVKEKFVVVTLRPIYLNCHDLSRRSSEWRGRLAHGPEILASVSTDSNPNPNPNPNLSTSHFDSSAQCQSYQFLY